MRSRQPAEALDQGGDAGAAEGLHHGPDRHAAGAARQFGHEGGGHAVVLADRRQVARPLRHGALVRLAVRDDGEAAVEGHLQPLVAVGHPGIGTLDAGGQVLSRGEERAQRPKAPSTCTQAPACLAIGTIWSKGSKAPVLIWPAWAMTIFGPGWLADLGFERLGPHAALVVGGDADHAVVAEADELQRREDRGMRVGAEQHGDRRRAEEAVGIGIPALLRAAAGCGRRRGRPCCRRSRR